MSTPAPRPPTSAELLQQTRALVVAWSRVIRANFLTALSVAVKALSSGMRNVGGKFRVVGMGRSRDHARALLLGGTSAFTDTGAKATAGGENPGNSTAPTRDLPESSAQKRRPTARFGTAARAGTKVDGLRDAGMAFWNRIRVRTVPTVMKVAACAFVLTLFTIVLPAAASRFPALGGVPKWNLKGLPLANRAPAPSDLTLAPSGLQLPPRDRIVALANSLSPEVMLFNVGPGGYVRSDQVSSLEHIARCRRTSRELPINPKVVDMLADVAEHWPGHVIELVSGVRAPPYGAPHSRHFIGYAIDLRVRGVPITEVRDFIWNTHHNVGVGYYPEGNFVHMDTRTSDQEIAWSGHGDSLPLEYHPRWSQHARPGAPAPSLLETSPEEEDDEAVGQELALDRGPSPRKQTPLSAE